MLAVEVAVSVVAPPLQIVNEGLAVTEMVGVAFTMMLTSSKVEAQGGFEMVQRKVVTPTDNPVTPVVALVGEMMDGLPGPATTDHIPEPTVGVFPVMVAVEVGLQIFWSGPAKEAEGGWLTFTVTVFVPAHPLVVPVTVYVIVDVGLATGLDIEGLLKLVGGDQL